MVDSAAAPLVLLAFTGLMTVVGATLATNYRGIATRHVRMSQQWSPRLHRGATDLARFVLFERMLGVLFAVVGVATFLLTLIDLIIGPGRLIDYGP